MKGSTILLNFILWPLMQLAVARAFLSLPDHWFQQGTQTLIPHRKELRLYHGILHVSRWKRLLPDGARWIGGGHGQSAVHTTDRDRLLRFVQETRRGEAAHWTAILCGFTFFLWNPPIAWPILLAVAIVLNAPCIMAQRYNRFVLLRWLQRR